MSTATPEITNPRLSYVLSDKGALQLSYDDVHYVGEKAQISNTMLGNHGSAFTARLGLDFFGSGSQATPAYHYLEKDATNPEGPAIGSGFGIEQVQAFLRVAGVNTWDELMGREIFPLYKDDLWAPMIGLFNPENNEILIFDKQLEAWKARQSA